MPEAIDRGGPLFLDDTATQVAIAPTDAAARAVMHSITITVTGGAPRLVTLGINDSLTDTDETHWLCDETEVLPGEPLEWEGWMPLLGHATTPDMLYGLCDEPDEVTIAVGMVVVT